MTKPLWQSSSNALKSCMTSTPPAPRRARNAPPCSARCSPRSAEGCYIEPPFHANWGGHHVHFGKNVYANFGLTLVDDTHIYVGDSTLFGPNVTVATAGHPLAPDLRARAYQYNAAVHIGKNCWIGAGAVILPGVSIGDHTVVGAGSVVTKDLPAGVVAVGNPCRVLRAIGEHDAIYFFRDKKIDYTDL